MPTEKTNRKRLFRAALALSDLTAEQWCYREGVRHPVLSTFLNGIRDDDGLAVKVDQFIEQHRNTYAALAS